MKTLFLASVAILTGVMATGAHAATEIEIRDVAARIIVIPEDRTDVTVSVKYPRQGLPTLTQRSSGNRLILNGGLKRRTSCRDKNAVQVKGIGHFANKDLPVLTVRVPRNVKVSASGAVYGEVRPSDSLNLSHGGCGNWTVGHTGNANFQIGGSGDIRAGDMRSARVSIGGSGKVTGLSATQLSAQIGGNGDIFYDDLSGPAEVSIGGSGNVQVKGGNIPDLKISIAGSGNVNIDGTVHDAKVAIMGSGDVSLGRVTGNMSRSVMGSGRINVGQ